jgi:hypothetical protein
VGKAKGWNVWAMYSDPADSQKKVWMEIDSDLSGKAAREGADRRMTAAARLGMPEAVFVALPVGTVPVEKEK